MERAKLANEVLRLDLLTEVDTRRRNTVILILDIRQAKKIKLTRKGASLSCRALDLETVDETTNLQTVFEEAQADSEPVVSFAVRSWFLGELAPDDDLVAVVTILNDPTKDCSLEVASNGLMKLHPRALAVTRLITAIENYRLMRETLFSYVDAVRLVIMPSIVRRETKRSSRSTLLVRWCRRSSNTFLGDSSNM